MRSQQGPSFVMFPVPTTHPAWALIDGTNEPHTAQQDNVMTLLESILRDFIRRAGRNALLRRNPALRWDEAHPATGVDPDLCLIEPAPPYPEEELRSLRLWMPGMHAPRIAVEVVSDSTAEKDYREGPLKYAASGVEELWVFDPSLLGPSDRNGPWRLQVWSQQPNGVLKLVYTGEGPARSEVLDAWLVVTDAGRRLRLSDDAAGTALWPTEAEEAATERAAKEAALAELAALKAQLASRG